MSQKCVILFYILKIVTRFQTDQGEGKHPYQEKEPLEAWPNDVNPYTGEIGSILQLCTLYHSHKLDLNDTNTHV